MSGSRDATRDGPRAGRPPLYERITRLLGEALRGGHIPPGAVLLEGPIAELLRCTRTPVRQALHELQAQGLVSRFEGRGVVAGPPGTPPRRLALQPAMLGLAEAAEPVRKTLGWESIYDAVESEVVHLSVFDPDRINELELARHHGVGRMVARDVLMRLESLGLVRKDERLRWVVIPLDAQRINHLYELRWLLEPAALRSAMAAGPPPDLPAMVAALQAAMATYPELTGTAMDALEHDLHVACLSRCANQDLLDSLQRTRCLLTLSKHVLGVSAPMPQSDPFMADHLAVFDAMAAGDADTAAAQLRHHLEVSCLKVIERAAQVRADYPKPRLPYIA